ncbi:MAG: DMT family transporter [Proteobacteria bacterium]|nr:DMT family transporter [Pseudomonadota bacterium]
MPDQRLTLPEYAALFAIVVIWGVNNAAAKVVTEVVPPLFVGAWRFGMAALVLLPFLRPPFPRPWRLTAWVAALGTLHFAVVYICFAWAEDLTPLAVSLQLWIPFVALLSWILLKEPLQPAAVAGLAVSFVGVVVMTADPSAFRDWRAIALGAFASLIWAGATLAARRAAMPPLKLQALLSVVAAPILFAGSLAFEPDWDDAFRAATPMIWVCMLWAALVSTVAATGLLFWLVQKREAGRVTPYLLLTPVCSIAIGAGFLGDVLTPQILIGAAAVIGGIALVSLAERGLRSGAARG